MTAEITEALFFVCWMCAEEAEEERWEQTIHSQKNPAPGGTAQLFPINFPKGRICPIVSQPLGQLHKQTNKQKNPPCCS